MFMNKLFLSVALLVVAPAFVFAAAPAAVEAATQTLPAAPAAAVAPVVDANVAKIEAAKTALETAKTALKNNTDTTQTATLKAAVDTAQAAYNDLNPSYFSQALTFANNQVANLRGVIVGHPLSAVTAAFVLGGATVAAVNYFTAEEADEDVQF